MDGSRNNVVTLTFIMEIQDTSRDVGKAEEFCSPGGTIETSAPSAGFQNRNILQRIWKEKSQSITYKRGYVICTLTVTLNITRVHHQTEERQTLPLWIPFSRLHLIAEQKVRESKEKRRELFSRLHVLAQQMVREPSQRRLIRKKHRHQQESDHLQLEDAHPGLVM